MVEFKNIPELRFTEFEGCWSEKKMGEVFVNCRKRGDNTLPIYSVSQELGLIPRESLGRSIQKDADSELNLAVDRNDLVYNMMRMWQGAFGIAKTDCMVSPAYIVLKPKKEEFAQFYSYYLSNRRSQYLFWAYSYGLTNDRLRLYFKDFSRIKRSVPNIIEQQKIASFLTAIDKKISQLNQKRTLLEEYKKGVMQNIFSQEIRFRDYNGQAFPRWEKKRLGEIAAFSKGKGISKNDIVDDGDIECIRYGELYTDYHETIDVVKSRTNVLPSELVFSEEDDVIIPASGETQIDIAKASCVLKSGIALGGDLNVIRSEYNGVFLSYYLNSKKKRDIAKLAQGTSVVHLYSSQLSLLKVEIPSQSEQNKIANFLSTIDNKTNHTLSQIEKAELWKKGMLQKMFV